MSTQQPPGRRRRIAGERRRADDAPPPGTAQQPDSAPDPAPVSLDKSAVEPAGQTGGGWWGSRTSIVTLAAVLVVALVITALASLGLLGVGGFKDVRQADQTASASRAASAAAERAAEAILAYDYRSLDEDRDAAARFMTPDYAEDYVGTFDTAVKEAAKSAQAEVSVEVKGSAVMTAGVDRVRVLLFLDQTSLSTSFDKPQVALNRVELQMVKRGDSWLVDDILSF